MSYYTPPPKVTTELVSRPRYAGIGASLETIGTGTKNFLTGAIDVFGHALNTISGQSQQPTVVQAESGMPSWLLPVGAAALVGGVILLRRRRK